MNGPLATIGPRSPGGDPPPEPHLELNRLLVPVDFSPPSQRGLALAGALAGRFQAQIDLLYVIEPPALPVWGYAHIPQREAKLRRAAEERFPQLPSACGLAPPLIRSAAIRRGEAGEEICRAAAEGQTDLIVLAPRLRASPRARRVTSRAWTGSESRPS